MNFLDDEFLKPYENKEVPFGPLGYIVYKRTYARDLGARTEEWWETCKRVINGNLQLEVDYFNSLNAYDDEFFPFSSHINSLKEEAKSMYDDMFNLKWLPGGRGIWVSGTDISKLEGSALTNCYYVDIKPKDGKVSHPFAFAMDMLMLGSGVGFGVKEEFTSQIPKLLNPVDVFIICSEDHKNFNSLKVQNKDGDWWDKTHQKIHVEDSRKGWVYSLKKVIDSFFLSKKGNLKTLVIDVSKVRPEGEKIKGFGGKASGPGSLVELLRSVSSILNRVYKTSGYLTSVECTDIMTLIGRCVVAGNVRRSALIALGDGDDYKFMGMKNPLEWEEARKLGMNLHEYEYHNSRIKKNRCFSNNSVNVDGNFDGEYLSNSIWVKGEPGFFNLENMRKYGRLIDGIDYRDNNASGTNPCAEITLESQEPCNLAEIFPSNCSPNEHGRVAIHAFRYAKRVTLSKYNWEETKKVVEKNRRVGISISGLQDWVLQLEEELGSGPRLDTLTYLESRLDYLYKAIKSEDKHFSRFLNINESIKITTIKPSGTISLLAGVSNGMHWPYAKYYIRRIQMQENDSLVAYLKDCGFTVTKAVQTPNAVICHFPIKAKYADSPNFKTADQVSAREQLQFVELLQTWWADNQVSCTVSFKESDKEELKDLIDEFSKKLKSGSFLPYTPKLIEHYPDLPFEPISQEKYEEMLKSIDKWPSRLNNDKGEDDLLNLDECSGGHCPIR